MSPSKLLLVLCLCVTGCTAVFEGWRNRFGLKKIAQPVKSLGSSIVKDAIATAKKAVSKKISNSIKDMILSDNESDNDVPSVDNEPTITQNEESAEKLSKLKAFIVANKNKLQNFVRKKLRGRHAKVITRISGRLRRRKPTPKPDDDDDDEDERAAKRWRGRKQTLQIGKLKGRRKVKDSKTADRLNIAGCPIRYYGRTYRSLYVNFTQEAFYMCFDRYFRNGSLGDCVKMPSLSEEGVKVVVSRRVRTDRHLLRRFPALGRRRARCSSQIQLRFTDELSVLTIFRFGPQSVFHLEANVMGINETVDFFANGERQAHWILSGSSDSSVDHFLLATACRYRGSVIAPDTEISLDPDTCSSMHCNRFGAIRKKDCGRLQTCLGNNTCGLDAVCMLLGPALVDFTGSVELIPDRCGYRLFGTTGISVKASFRERRRPDLNFIDSITVQIDSNTVRLEPAGRVYVNDDEFSVSPFPRELGGLLIFEDETGITLKKTSDPISLRVVFDGTTAEIAASGASSDDITGLCADANRFRRNVIRAEGCNVQHSEPPDRPMDPVAVTKRCKEFKGEQFSACHEEIDPDPFTEACEKIFSKSLDKDGLYCQLIEAYARACNQRINSSQQLEDATARLGCAGSLEVCADVPCADHEFCRISSRKEPECWCRALFAAPYREARSYGHPSVCTPTSASLTLLGCLLLEKGFESSELHLEDRGCQGEVDPETHMLTFSYNRSHPCGAEIAVNDREIVYRNTVTSGNSSSEKILRSADFHIDFSCVYVKPEPQTLLIRVEETSVVQRIVGVWNYTLQMESFLDEGRLSPITPNVTLQLNRKIWVEVRVLELSGAKFSDKFNLVMDHCWATPTPEQQGALNHTLVTDGCADPHDATATVKENGVGPSSVFAFNVFQFNGHANFIYLHCKLRLCFDGEGESCRPPCPEVLPRSRRDTNQAVARGDRRHHLTPPVVISLSFSG